MKKKQIKSKKFQIGFFSELKDSFVELKSAKTIHIIFFDMLFYFILLAVASIFSYITYKIGAPLMDLTDTGLQNVANTAFSSSKFILVVFLIFIIAAIIIYLSWVLTRYLIWTTLNDAKKSFSGALGFLGLNVLWHLILIILFILGNLILKRFSESNASSFLIYSVFIILTLIGILLWIYTNIIYYCYTKTGKVLNSLKNIYKIGILRIKSLLLPTLAAIAVIIIWSLFSLLLNLISVAFAKIINIVIMVAFVTWTKYYYKIIFTRSFKPDAGSKLRNSKH